MILAIAQKAAAAALLVVLLFNLTQRKHLAHGELKRYASLYYAGFLLIFGAVTVIFQRTGAPPILLIPAAALEIGVLALFRRQLFLFRLRCATCGARLPLERVLYYDSNRCPTCDPDPEAIRAARAALVDSPISRGAEVSSLRSGPRELPAEEAGASTAVEGPTRPAAPAGSEALPATLASPIPRRVEEIDWTTWRPKERAVLCYVERDSQLLLIHKKRGLGAGKINAPGGRIEEGETSLQAAVRECEEEIGITPRALRQAAELSFQFVDGYSLLGYVYLASSFTGTPRPSDEADPFWCSRTELPYDRMWEDDRLWLPEVLAGRFVVGRFIFEGDSMLSHLLTAR